MGRIFFRMVMLLSLLACSPCYISAQPASKVTFDHLGIEEGLSQSSVFAITQDADGFMWFGTRDGLNRYDSRMIRTYRHEANNPQSISGNSVHCLLVDSKKQLWVGTSEGINIYRAASDNFVRGKLNPDSDEGLHNNHIAAIHETKNGTIWIGTHGGLSKVISRDPLRFIHFRHSDTIASSLLDDEIRALYTDHAGNLWVGTTKGISKLVEASGKYTFINYPIHSTHIQGKTWINSILEDDQGNILIATEQSGIKVLDPNTGNITSFTFQNNEGRDIETVRVIQRDNHTLWIGTLEGLYTYDLRSGTSHFFRNDPDNNLSLSDNSVRSIFKDPSGTHWIGTFYGGVNYYSPLSRQFEKINLKDQQNREIYKIAGAIMTDDQHNLWIGTDGNGLFCQNTKGKIIAQFKHNPDDANSISHNKIKCLLREDNGLWIGTINGLNFYDFRRKKIQRYFHNAQDTASLPDDRIYDLKRDTDGNLWIGTYRGGLCRLNRKTMTFEKIEHRAADSTSLSSDGITYIYEDREHNLWIGTVSGLNKKLRGKNTFVRYVNARNQNNMYVLCVYEDKQKRLWVGTRDTGLKLKTADNTFRTFTVDDGLAGNSVNGILEDARGILWISTENGLSRFDPATFTCKNYNKNDGLICSEFNFNSFHKDIAGFMYFGGYNGIVKFHPDSIRENAAPPVLQFTRLKLFNKEVTIGAGSILHTNLSQTANLEFAHSENIFSLEFASLNFIHPGKNRYAYKLEGFEEQWNYVSEPIATYMNLSPGKYTLLVKGSNNDGVWSEHPVQMKITVLPPLWKTWWAYGIYCAIILLLVYALLRFNKMRWKLVHDLKIEQMEKDQQDKLHKAKLNFFTNIAHEIRTPLTLMVSPLEQAIEHVQANEPVLQKQLRTIQSNTGRLTRLVNQLLDFQKQESGTLKLKTAEGNIIALLQEVIFTCTEYAQARNIQLHFTAPEEAIYLRYDRDELEKVFYNLLYNAFKFTPGGGRISLAVFKEDIASANIPSSVKIILEDNGIGIAEADVPKIFNRFFQVENAGVREAGFGIGLSLTKGIIDLHGGAITVESQEAELGQSGFTRFVITLPVHLPSAEAPAIFPDSTTEKHTASIYIPVCPDQPVAIKSTRASAHQILLVEDNAEIRSCIRDILATHYNVVEAANGSEALPLARRNLPDVIISDIAMPAMDGLEFTRHIKNDERTRHIPVILLTARSAAEHQIEGIDCGADEYITKPFHSRILLLKIRNLLAMREQLKEKYQKIVTLQPPHEEVEDPDNKFLQRLMGILDVNLNDADFNVTKLVSEIGMSRPVLFRKVKMLTGLSVIDLIRSTRLKKAEMLLRQKKMTISEVAFTVGFNDPKYFSKSFHAQFGTTPSRYMESLE
ncbi:MAG TPA: two-component regulator propeller domain-containing protein [Ohtaekwangia sp.]|uniref:two-component regulator propeller domain-containing protein n=1 Tax=Ohtaekwangia sp. TaxID=2066019 RepID=UPI002F94CCA0